MVSGYTAADGTVVPAGTYNPAGGGTGTLTTQVSSCCNVNWYGGAQAMLSNGGGTVKDGDSATLSFEIPKTETGGVPTAGAWDIGVDFTKSYDYGTYSITLDANSVLKTPVTLLSSFDAYSGRTLTQYEDLGVPQSGGSPVDLTTGVVYSITFTLTGQDPTSTGYQLGFDVLRLAPMAATCSITSMSSCYNNTAISSATDLSSANADGYGDSYPADQLGSSSSSGAG